MRRTVFALPTALILYFLVLAPAAWLLKQSTLAQATARPLVALLTLAPAAGVVVLGVRRYQDLDELGQRIHLMALAVTFLGTLFLAFTGVWVALVGQTEATVDIIFRIGPLGVSLGLLAAIVGLYFVGWLWARRQYR